MKKRTKPITAKEAGALRWKGVPKTERTAHMSALAKERHAKERREKEANGG